MAPNVELIEADLTSKQLSPNAAPTAHSIQVLQCRFNQLRRNPAARPSTCRRLLQQHEAALIERRVGSRGPVDQQIGRGNDLW